MTRNEAAERLRVLFSDDRPRIRRLLDDALAAEWDAGVKAGEARGRRATVERIRERLDGLDGTDALYVIEPNYDNERQTIYGLRLDTMLAVLDEEAAR